MKTHIKDTGGNCVPGDPTELLEVITDTFKEKNSELDITTVGMIRRYDLLIREPVRSDHDYTDIPSISSLSAFQEAIHPYIAGSAGKLTSKTSHCPSCRESLGSRNHQSSSSFLNMRDKGGLFKPSESVLAICKLTELKVRQLLRVSDGKLPQGML